MEYLIEETEHIMEKDSMYPFTPYTKAFSYGEMWRAVVPAYDGVVKEFWDFAGDNMYSAEEHHGERLRRFFDAFRYHSNFASPSTIT